MLLRLVGFLLLASSVMADLASIQKALDAINAGLLKLDKAIVGLPVTSHFLATLTAVAVPILNNATQIIQQSGPLSLNESSSIGASTAALRLNSNLTITDLLAQRPYFVNTRSTAILAQGLIDERAASVALGDAIVNKVPAVVQVQARQAVKEIFDIYDRGIALFSNLSLDTGVPRPPRLHTRPNASDFTPVLLPVPLALQIPVPAGPTVAPGLQVPPAAGVFSSTGAQSVDGSCSCAVQCPAGSLDMSALTQITGGVSARGTSGASGLQMFPRMPEPFFF